MNFNKYFAFLAIFVLCLLGQQAVEAHHHHHRFGKIGHELDKGFKKVEKVASDINKAKTVIKAGAAVAGAIEAV
ncbi:uncharacterized protein ACRADG_007250 [Cochliomyia hominivorax]